MEKAGKRSIRVWTEVDLDEVKKHLLLIEDLYGSCGNCKQLGLNYLKDKSCPACKNEFRYIATRLKTPGDIAKILARIHAESLKLTLIDRDDYDKATAKDVLGGLFSKDPGK